MSQEKDMPQEKDKLENNTEENENDPHFFVKFAEAIGNEKLVEIAKEYTREEETEEFIPGSGSLKLPSNEKVIKRGLENLIRKKQKEIARQENIEDYKQIEVDLDVGKPQELIEDFDSVLYNVSDELVQYLDDNSIFDNDSPTLEEDGAELITYIIQKNRDENIVVIGGSECVRRNIVMSQLDINKDEEDLIKYIHNQAARENGFNAHLLLDDVLFVPVRGEKIE